MQTHCMHPYFCWTLRSFFEKWCRQNTTSLIIIFEIHIWSSIIFNIISCMVYSYQWSVLLRIMIFWRQEKMLGQLLLCNKYTKFENNYLNVTLSYHTTSHPTARRKKEEDRLRWSNDIILWNKAIHFNLIQDVLKM